MTLCHAVVVTHPRLPLDRGDFCEVAGFLRRTERGCYAGVLVVPLADTDADYDFLRVEEQFCLTTGTTFS